MNEKTIHRLSGNFILWSFLLLSTLISRAQNTMNVVFIVADDLNTNLGCYGQQGVITPNLDKLASESLVFDRAYCQASLCNPSRSSFMTGMRPGSLDIYTNEPHFRGVFPKVKTIAQSFKENGYISQGIGKIFHNWGQAIHGDPDSWSLPEVNHYAAHYQDMYVPGRAFALHSDIEKGPAVQCVDVPDEAYLDGRISSRAVQAIKEAGEAKFFLAVGFWKPHLPYNAPKKYWDLYDREALPILKYPHEVPGVSEFAYIGSSEARSYTDVPKTGEISQNKKRELRHGYLAAISYLDAQIGKIMDALEKQDLRKNTIIVVLSDHGYHAGEHGQFGKWTQFEQGTRVPLFISVPGMDNHGKRSSSLVELIDLFPSLVDLCGISTRSYQGQLEGKSLVPVLKDPSFKVKDFAISQISRLQSGGPGFGILGSSIRNERYRFNIWQDRQTGKIVSEELFDLQKDVDNATNISDLKSAQSIKEDLLSKLNTVLIRNRVDH